MEVLHNLLDLVGSFSNSPYALLFLALIAFAESSFFPIPPDILLIPMALANPPLAMLYALVTTVMSVIGGCFGYLIGVKGGKPILKKLFSEEKVDVVRRYYQRYDVWAVGIAAFTPIPYKVFTIAAGVFDLDFKRFTLVSFLGRGGRFFLVAGMIWVFGDAIKYFLENYFEVAVIVFTLLLIGGFWAFGHIGKRLNKKS